MRGSQALSLLTERPVPERSRGEPGRVERPNYWMDTETGEKNWWGNMRFLRQTLYLRSLKLKYKITLVFLAGVVGRAVD